MASSEPRSLKSGNFSLWGRSVIRVFEILECLSIWGRYGWVLEFFWVMHKMFPCMSIHKAQARPRRTHQLLHSIGLMVTRHFRFSYRFVREMFLSAFVVALSIESTIDLSRVRHLYYSRSIASVIFLWSQRSRRGHLLISFNYFVENTPINTNTLN